MILINFSFKKILVEKKENFSGKVEIKSNINILNLEKSPYQTADKMDILKITYEIKYTYEEQASLQFEGELLIAVSPKESEQILKEWKKDQKLTKEPKLEIYNIIFYKCNLKALQLEQDVNLPSHIQLPILKVEEDKKK